MTAQELMEVLSKLDPNTVIYVWNGEWDAKDPINEIEVDRDGDVVIF